jgi:hypothetical protein
MMACPLELPPSEGAAFMHLDRNAPSPAVWQRSGAAAPEGHTHLLPTLEAGNHQVWLPPRLSSDTTVDTGHDQRVAVPTDIPLVLQRKLNPAAKSDLPRRLRIPLCKHKILRSLFESHPHQNIDALRRDPPLLSLIGAPQASSNPR